MKTKRMAECHPDRPYFAKGLCKKCYSHKYNIERGAEMRRVRYARNQGADRERHLNLKYGITIEEYDLILESQNNGCAICGKTPEENGKRLGVDHNHETGEVRGLLCDACNFMLGKAQDNIDILLSAISYLRIQ